MIGCDDAHSWTRRQLGHKLEGEQTDYIWYVTVSQPGVLADVQLPGVYSTSFQLQIS